MALSQEKKDALSAAFVGVETAVQSLGSAYGALLAAYDAARTEVFQNGGTLSASAFASGIGPDRWNVAIYGAMLAQGLDPLLLRTSIRADHRPIADLAAELSSLLSGV